MRNKDTPSSHGLGEDLSQVISEHSAFSHNDSLQQVILKQRSFLKPANPHAISMISQYKTKPLMDIPSSRGSDDLNSSSVFMFRNTDIKYKADSGFTSYYLSFVLINALMVTFYAVQAFTESPECLSAEGRQIADKDKGTMPHVKNVTHWFEIAF